MTQHTPIAKNCKPSPYTAFPRSQSKESTKNAESFAGQESHMCPANLRPPKKAKMPPLNVEHIEWIHDRLTRSIELAAGNGGVGFWHCPIRRHDRTELERIFKVLRRRDRLLNRWIDRISFGETFVTVWVWGTSHE